MPREYIEVHNPHRADITFRLDKAVDSTISAMAMHKQKRLLRTYSYNAKVPSRQSVELVSLSGLSLKEIKESTEFRQMLPRLVVIADSSVVKEIDIQQVDPVEIDDIDPVLPEDEIEEVIPEETQEEAPEETLAFDTVEEDDLVDEDFLKAELKSAHKKPGRRKKSNAS